MQRAALLLAGLLLTAANAAAAETVAPPAQFAEPGAELSLSMKVTPPGALRRRFFRRG